MADKQNYKIENIYQGSYSSLDPTKGELFTGYRMPAENLSLSTDARTANIVQEIGSKISSGVKNVEASQVFPEVFDSIPKQQFKELGRLMKLTGVQVSLHGPLIEASGLTQQGEFTESSRESAERHMMSVVDKNQLINPQGNTPITFHSSSGLPGGVVSKGKEAESVVVINSDTKSVNKIPLEKRRFPGEENKINAKKEIEKMNEDSWSEAIRSMTYYADIGLNSINRSGIFKVLEDEFEKKELPQEFKQAKSDFRSGATFLNDSYRQLTRLFETAYRHATPEDKKILDNFSKEIEEKAKKISENKNSNESILLRRDIINRGEEIFSEISPPQTLKVLKEFAQDKTVTTFGNVALHAYKKFKDKAPIISIENPPVESGAEFTTGEDIKNLVEESRKKFVEKAVMPEEKGGLGISKSEAKKQAERIIGATWDVGHINSMKKFGYTDEDIIKETEKVAPFVKHVHLADNFGLKDTELPIGMGNVPIKEIMEKLGEKGFEGKRVIEALQWWQHFKTPPLQETLEAFGSPIYPMKAGPYWNQAAGFHQDYFGGYGMILPEGHYGSFGAGFSQLPTELGGQRGGGGGSRMSGRPME